MKKLSGIIFHHDDPDGILSKEIILPRAAIDMGCDIDEIETRSMSHDNNNLGVLDAVPDGVFAVVVDFSFDIEEMKRFQRRNGLAKLVVIDHHIKFIEKAEQEGFSAPGLLDPREAACELCWDIAHPDIPLNRDSLPRMVGEYDSFRSAGVPERHRRLEFFFYGCLSHPDGDPWWRELAELSSLDVASGSVEWFTEKTINDGAAVMRYNTERWYNNLRDGAFLVVHDTNVLLALHTTERGSRQFEGMFDPNKHHGALAIRHRPDQSLAFSVYSPDTKRFDAGEFAVHHGGLGHAGAAGGKLPAFPDDWHIKGVRD
jgi:hypothetical protein